MKCTNCKNDAVNGVRCPGCAETHRNKVMNRYYETRYGQKPERDLTRGMRSPIRDQILLLMADGVARTSVEIAESIKWEKTTSITKTLGDIKEVLALRGDSRKLKKVRLGASPRSGTQWQLIDTKSNDQEN